MRIEIQASKQQLTSNKSRVRRSEKKHRRLLSQYDAITSDTELLGKGYAALKSRIAESDQPLSKGFVSYTLSLGCLYEAQKGYINTYFPASATYQDSAEIEAQIAKLKKRITSLHAQSAIPATAPARYAQIYLLTRMVKELNGKLEQMRQYETITGTMYDDANDFATTLKRGIRYSGSMIWQNGWKAQLGADDTTWQTDLEKNAKDTWWNVVNRARAFIYGNKAGLYGGNQAGPRSYFNTKAKRAAELVTILDKYAAFQNMTDAEQLNLLRNINNTGCGYTVLANAIIEQYYYRQEDFKRDFGFSLLRTENNTKVINYEPLIVDLYCAYTDQEVVKNGTTAAAEYKGIHPSDAFFSEYYNGRTSGSQTVSVDMVTYNSNRNYTETVKQGNVAIYTNSNITYQAAGKTLNSSTVTGAHTSMMTSADHSGANPVFTISSWGNKYTVTRSDHVYIFDWSTP
jgi:hypothetical protein